ncbi:MAG TPA: hypothetical protein VF339_17100 [Gammaproteobacteria bacterium]
MLRHSTVKRIAAVVLLFVLVAAEAVAVAHSLDFDAHVPGDPCKLCVSAAGLVAGVPATPAAAEPPRTHEPVGAVHVPPVPAPRPERASARGPPVLS